MSHRTCGSSPPCTRHPIHACAPVCCVLVVFSSPVLSSTSSHRSPSSPSRCSPQRSTRGPGPIPCATSAWGPWSHPTMRHPSQNMHHFVIAQPSVVSGLHPPDLAAIAARFLPTLKDSPQLLLLRLGVIRFQVHSPGHLLRRFPSGWTVRKPCCLPCRALGVSDTPKRPPRCRPSSGCPAVLPQGHCSSVACSRNLVHPSPWRSPAADPLSTLRSPARTCLRQPAVLTATVTTAVAQAPLWTGAESPYGLQIGGEHDCHAERPGHRDWGCDDSDFIPLDLD